MRQLGSLLTDFFDKNLEFAQYLDTKDNFPSLTIKKHYYSMRPWNPFSIKVSFKDKSEEFPDAFLVYKTGKDDRRYFWTALSPRSVFIDPVGPFPTWEDALRGLEVHCMETIDSHELSWDNIVEM